jgi:hypothetical protein
MNRTQINYFESKIEAAKRQVGLAIREMATKLPDLSTEEKAAQILSGKARFKIEKFSGSECPWNADNLFSFFDFEGEDEITAKNAAIQKQTEKTIAKANREADRLETNFVLEKVKDPVKALDDFIAKYTPKGE